MGIRGFIVGILMLALSSSLLHGQSGTESETEKMLLGKWTFSKDNGSFTATWDFRKDGTVVSDRGILNGTWEIRQKVVYISWGKNWEEFILPLDPKMTRCNSWNGGANCATAVKQSTMTAGSAPAAGKSFESAVFRQANKALVVVTSSDGAASGFIVNMNGSQYLVTNIHVVRARRPLRFAKLDGTEIADLSTVELCESMDLVRMKLTKASETALELQTSELNIGDGICILGNSDGAGVITTLGGKVVGIGPQLVEVDATFVSGNSGSPMLDTEGKVVGVATYVARDFDPNNWVKEGSRFNEVRRFGMRLALAKWTEVDFNAYLTRSDVMADIETFCEDAGKFSSRRAAVHSAGPKVDRKDVRHQYDYKSDVKRYRTETGFRLCQLLHESVDDWNGAATRWTGETKPLGNSGHDAVKRMAEEQRIGDRARGCDVHYYQACDYALTIVQKNDWMTPQLTSEAAYYKRLLGILRSFPAEAPFNNSKHQ